MAKDVVNPSNLSRKKSFVRLDLSPPSGGFGGEGFWMVAPFSPLGHNIRFEKTFLKK